MIVVGAAGVRQEDVRGWAEGLDEVAEGIGRHFARREAREWALEYIRALLSPAERKPGTRDSGWGQLAEIAGDDNPYGLQNLLGRAEGVKFRTKPEIGRRMLQRALDAGVPARWILADEVYGGDFKLRLLLEERCQRYVLGVVSNQPGTRASGWGVGFYQLRVDELIRGLPKGAWSRLGCGEGSKGPRVYNWARARLNCPVEGWERWALCRRSISDPEELAYYLVFVPAGTSLKEMVRAAGSRWTIEEAIEEAKGEVGLDQYEVRSWRGCYRHITLSMLAHAYLSVTRAKASPETAKGGALRPQGASSLTGFKRKQGLVS